MRTPKYQLGRRSFMQLVAANSALLAVRRAVAGTTYNVGVGYSSNSYTAASVAVTSCGQFPANLSGQTVVIKPNLVVPQPSTTGATTDPLVVQAVVDLAIAAGCTQILIVEAALPGKPPDWDACGYTAVFQNYPQVQLVDLRTGPYVLTPVPGGGLAYQSMWVPSLVLQPNTYFISAGKMKTHTNAVVTLSLKNLVGLASETAYGDPGTTNYPRHDLHFRGIDQSIVDLNMVRPVDFAVIDGIWGMQGKGPVHGTPVPTDVVLAGLNPVAVDRVALNVMELSNETITYLTYATAAGLGPADTSNVTLLGNSYIPYPYQPAPVPPTLWMPTVSPSTISLSAGQEAAISYQIGSTCYTLADIIQDSDSTPSINEIRTIHGFKQVAAPGETVRWKGMNSSNQPVAPGLYLARIQARTTPNSEPINYAVARITVVP